jgi:hypothetical protein
VPHPVGLPDLFLDRSLGRIRVPELLRAEGLRLVTLAERYGMPRDAQITDEEWLSEAGQRGEVVFLKDGRVRYRPAEKAAIVSHGVKCFCLTRRDLRADEMARRYLDNLETIASLATRPGGAVFAVHATRVEQLRIG